MRFAIFLAMSISRARPKVLKKSLKAARSISKKQETAPVRKSMRLIARGMRTTWLYSANIRGKSCRPPAPTTTAPGPRTIEAHPLLCLFASLSLCHCQRDQRECISWCHDNTLCAPRLQQYIRFMTDDPLPSARQLNQIAIYCSITLISLLSGISCQIVSFRVKIILKNI